MSFSVAHLGAKATRVPLTRPELLGDGGPLCTRDESGCASSTTIGHPGDRDPDPRAGPHTRLWEKPDVLTLSGVEV